MMDTLEETDTKLNEVTDILHRKNKEQYNILKAAEECQELSLALIHLLTKPDKVDKQKVIDEIGDVIIRIKILVKMFDEEEIIKRIENKLSEYKEFNDNKKYENI